MIREFQDSDYSDLFQLYQKQSGSLPFHHAVGREQFRSDLFTTRFIRDPDDHNSAARIALVAFENDELKAFVSGGLVVTGDEVVDGNTGYVQAIIAEPGARELVRQLLVRVLEHLRRFNPDKITAHDACMCPVFFADSAGSLPSSWAWIGQCLRTVGFSTRSSLARLVATLDEPRVEVQPPGELRFLHVIHEMKLVDPEYDFSCLLMKPPYKYGDGAVWCGNFYSGAFVQGAAFQSLYMNYFWIMDEEYRGKGMGRLVLQHCLFEAQKKGARYASLLTNTDNFVAMSLYLSEGFKVVDVMNSFELKPDSQADGSD